MADTKYIFVTGGVASSLGKGIISSSIGKLLQARGYSVTIQKFDPYINIDPGTLNPYEHGECYVTVDGHEADLHKNPYIAYNCARPAGRYMVVSNGSQTDPIAEKIGINVPVRDAITMGLLAMDYEKDQLDTPRIVGVISQDGEEAYLGIIRKDAVMVRRFTPKNGELFYISTYEKNYTCPDFNDGNFNVQNALEAADYITGKGVFADFTNPVTAAAALASGNGFELAVTRVD